MKTYTFSILIGIALVFSACGGSKETKNTPINAEDLSVGSKLSNLSISEITTEKEYGEVTIKFSDAIEIEGAMWHSTSPDMIGVSGTILTESLVYNDNTYDLSQQGVSFRNSDELEKLIPEHMREANVTTGGWQLKEEFNGKIAVKLRINNIEYYNASPFPLMASIAEVIEFNGAAPVVVEEATTSETESEELITIGARFSMRATSTDGGYYIFVDERGNQLMFFDEGMPPGLEFANDVPLNEGYENEDEMFDITYITKNRDFYDGGTGENVSREINVLKYVVKRKVVDINSIKAGDVLDFDGLAVKSISVESDGYTIDFSGEATYSGELWYNEHEGTIEYNVASNIYLQTAAGKYPLRVVLFFTNPEDVKSTLLADELETLNNGGKVSIDMTVGNVKTGVTFDKGRLGLYSVDFYERVAPALDI